MIYGEKDWIVTESKEVDLEDDEEEELDPRCCEWCEQIREPIDHVRFYQNKHYSGRFGDCCIELVDLASEAVEKDNS